MEFSKEILVYDLCLLANFIFILWLSKLINNWLTPYCVNDQISAKDNPALCISITGYFIAVAIIFISSMLGPELLELNKTTIYKDLEMTTLYGLLGIILLNFSRVINDKFILYKFSNVKEIIEDRNSGTGVVQFASYVASGLMIGAAIHGEGGGIKTVLAFFVLGQIALILFSIIYNLFTPFDTHDEIEKDNIAAGVCLAGYLLALGIIIHRASLGDFYSWKENLTTFISVVLMALILLPLNRWVFNRILLSKASLKDEICTDKNIGVALIDASCALMIAGFFSFLMA